MIIPEAKLESVISKYEGLLIEEKVQLAFQRGLGFMDKKCIHLNGFSKIIHTEYNTISKLQKHALNHILVLKINI